MKQKRMKELRTQGVTLAEIAKAAKVPVKRVFDMTGGRVGPKRKEYAKHRPRNIQRDDRIKSNIAKGMLQKEVATLEGLSPQRIHQILKREVL